MQSGQLAAGSGFRFEVSNRSDPEVQILLNVSTNFFKTISPNYISNKNLFYSENNIIYAYFSSTKPKNVTDYAANDPDPTKNIRICDQDL
jgi:hypothetical protein